MKMLIMFFAVFIEMFLITRKSSIDFIKLGWSIKVLNGPVAYEGKTTAFVGLCTNKEKTIFMSIPYILNDSKMAGVSFWRAARLDIRHELRHMWQFETIPFELIEKDILGHTYAQSRIELDAYQYQLNDVDMPMSELSQLIQSDWA